jgi:putative transposase
LTVAAQACLVEDGDHLMRRHRYIELNPLRAAMVADAEHFSWSSYGSNAYGEATLLVSPHDGYLSPSSDPTERRRAYWAPVMETVAPDEVGRHLRACVASMPMGRGGFARRSKRSLAGRLVPARSAGQRRRMRKGNSDPNGT